jgi:osmotically inducible protein OsmC
MAIAQRRGSGVWEGLATKLARFMTDGGVPSGWSATWAARTERSDGQPSPEQARAADHLGCYATALSHALARAHAAPTGLQVGATFTLAPAGGEARVAAIDLEVRGHVPGLDQAGFEAMAGQIKPSCEFWAALAGTVEIRVRAFLVEPGPEQPIPPSLAERFA